MRAITPIIEKSATRRLCFFMAASASCWAFCVAVCGLMCSAVSMRGRLWVLVAPMGAMAGTTGFAGRTSVALFTAARRPAR